MSGEPSSRTTRMFATARWLSQCRGNSSRSQCLPEGCASGCHDYANAAFTVELARGSSAARRKADLRETFSAGWGWRPWPQPNGPRNAYRNSSASKLEGIGGPPRTRTGTPFGTRFSYHFGFRRPFGSWSGLSLHHRDHIIALGAARPVSTPPRSLGFGSGLAVKPSPTLSGSTPSVSTEALKLARVACVYQFRQRAVR